MIIDTSAVLAVLFGEPDAERFEREIAEAHRCKMSVANFLEAAMVLEGRAGTTGGYELDLFLEKASMELVPVSLEQARAARRAWRRFGKGNHLAGLNFGDCFAYALAEVTQEPLLFKGRDFSQTDIKVA